jgi:hypothetical protein
MKKMTTAQLRDQCLSHFTALGIPLEPASMEETLARAEKESLSHLQFLDGKQATLCGLHACPHICSSGTRKPVRVAEIPVKDAKTPPGM